MLLYGSVFPALKLGPAQCLCWHQEGWGSLRGLSSWLWLPVSRQMGGDVMPLSETPGWSLCPVVIQRTTQIYC